MSFKVHSLEKSKFLVFILSIQFALVGILLLDSFGIKFPFLRQIFAFLYLTFIPGFILIRIFNINQNNNVKTLIFSVCLSLFFVMFVGFFINLIAFYLKTSLFSFFNLIIIFSILVLFLSLILYFIEGGDCHSKFLINFFSLEKSETLIIFMLPFLSIGGTYFMNHYSNNLILILMLFILPIIFILTYLKFDKRMWPLFVFTFSLSILYYVSLTTPYLMGRDIHLENYFIRQILLRGWWDYTISHPYNAMLSDVMIFTTYSLFCGMAPVWVLKIIYPFLFSFVPLGLYVVWKDQTNEEISFLSVILFISYFGFYFELTQVARQGIAEIFLVTFLILISKKEIEISKTKMSLMLIICLSAIAVSHYGTSYIFLIFLGGSYLIKTFFERYVNQLESNLNKTLLIYSITFILAWYIFVAGATNFDAIIGIFKQILGSLGEFSSPNSVEGLSILMSEKSYTHNITKIIYLVVNLLISVGILISLFKKDLLNKIGLEQNFNFDYKALALFSYFTLLISIMIPYTSTQIGTPRLYHICLIFLSPYFTIGFLLIIKILNKKILNEKTSMRLINKNYLTLGFLALLFWFSTGLIYEVVNDEPSSVPLNTSINHPKFHFKQTEASSAIWLTLNEKSSSNIFSDEFGRFILYDYILDDYNNLKIFNNETYVANGNSYIFLHSSNVNIDEVVFMKRTPTDFYREYPSLRKSFFYLNFIKRSYKIYDNSESQVYYLPSDLPSGREKQ